MAAFRRRFRRSHTHQTKLHPLAIVAIVLGCSILIAVIIGNILNAVLDDDTYQKLTGGDPDSAPVEGMRPSSVRDVNAYPYLLGAPIDSMYGQTSSSLLLNTPTGDMQYQSILTSHYQKTIANEAPLLESMGELCYFVPYVSGVFYPQALAEPNVDLRYAITAEECALLREFVRAGGDEILLCGLPIDAPDAIVEYVKAVQAAVGESIPVGVAVRYEALANNNDWEPLARLSETADFCALDFADAQIPNDDTDDAGISPSAEALLKDYTYYLNAYRMRPLFAESQTAMISTAIMLRYPTFQVLGQK